MQTQQGLGSPSVTRERVPLPVVEIVEKFRSGVVALGAPPAMASDAERLALAMIERVFTPAGVTRYSDLTEGAVVTADVTFRKSDTVAVFAVQGPMTVTSSVPVSLAGLDVGTPMVTPSPTDAWYTEQFPVSIDGRSVCQVTFKFRLESEDRWYAPIAVIDPINGADGVVVISAGAITDLHMWCVE